MTIYNFRKFNDMIGTAGQPTKDELQAAAADGYQDVVNIATIEADSPLKNEDEVVTELGMGYYAIPVEWDQPLRSDFETFIGCMKGLRQRKVLVHCAANYRATAFVSLFAMSQLGLPESAANEFIQSVWEPLMYPAWDRLIREIKNDLTAG